MGFIRRDIANDVYSFATIFTSFDNCMSSSICKIPFIVICVVVGLIVLGILWCFLRCCLCGYRCCACCCGGCGGRREGRKDQSITGPPQPFPIIVQQPAYNQPPQYAYYNSRSDDALPIMPSLEKMQTQHIEVSVKEEHELVPMQHVNTQDSKGYVYDQPPTEPRNPDNGPRYPPTVRSYGQNGYGDPNQENFSHASSTYPNIPPALRGLEDSKGSIQQQQHRNNGYSEPGYIQPGYHNGSQPQQHLDTSTYHTQRRQEEWTVV